MPVPLLCVVVVTGAVVRAVVVPAVLVVPAVVLALVVVVVAPAVVVVVVVDAWLVVAPHVLPPELSRLIKVYPFVNSSKSSAHTMEPARPRLWAKRNLAQTVSTSSKPTHSPSATM